MKVLQLGKFYPILGGVEKVMWDLTRGLGEEGVKVDMLCAVKPGCGIEQKEFVLPLGENARVICVPALRNVAATMISPAMCRKLRKLIKDAQKAGEPYDIVHIHHPDPMAALALRLSGWKGKVVLHYHSDILKQKGLMKLYRPLQDWLLKRADKIVGTTPVYIAESPYLKEYQHKAAYLPIGIEPLVPDPAKASEIRERFTGKKIIWSLGRLVGYKGFGYLVEAMGYLGEEYVLAIGGDGPLLGELQRKAEDCGVAGRVHFLGRLSDEGRAAWFAACDVFALSSIWRTEAFAIVQIEAMSLGKPVVSTRIPGSGVAWVNKDSESGLTVPVCDPEALADAIGKVCSNAAYYSAGAGKRFDEMFTFRKMVSGCVEIYRNL